MKKKEKKPVDTTKVSGGISHIIGFNNFSDEDKDKKDDQKN